MPPAALVAATPQAQGEAVIRKAVSELRLWSLTREFAFVDPAPSQQPPAGAATAAPAKGTLPQQAAASGGRAGGGGGIPAGVALIKGWAEVLGEVSDHQALVGSLKQSPYAPLFKVRCWRVSGSHA
jgi:dynein heavy chain 2